MKVTEIEQKTCEEGDRFLLTGGVSPAELPAKPLK